MEKRREFEYNTEAISAVIGVILMVAVAIAMAAVAYAYSTGMIGEQQKITPTFSFNPIVDSNTLIITQMEKPTNWNDLKIIERQGSTDIVIQDQTGPKTGSISNGEGILINGHGLSGTVTLLVVYIPTGTLVYQFDFNDVTA